jgi:crossover junction endodeoxyribonuclease RusA
VPRLELIIKGIPASLQSSSPSKLRWKERVQLAAREAIHQEDEIYDECRGILVYFYFGSTDLDVDNIVKPVSDALCAIAFWDDKLVSEWVSRKTDLEITEIRDPPPPVAAVLEDWLAAKQPFVYVCIVGERPNHAELPQ